MLPNEYKYYHGTKKYILKQIVHQYIPKEMMERKKMGFGIPMEKWLMKKLKPLVTEHLSAQNLSQHELFNPAYVEQLTKSFFKGRTDFHLKI